MSEAGQCRYRKDVRDLKSEREKEKEMQTQQMADTLDENAKHIKQKQLEKQAIMEMDLVRGIFLAYQ